MNKHNHVEHIVKFQNKQIKNLITTNKQMKIYNTSPYQKVYRFIYFQNMS
jgi:hypothetical protein